MFSSNQNNMNDVEDEQEVEYLRKLFIGGLHPSTTVETLEEYFAKFGKVTEAKVMKDENGKTRGFGFITYDRAAMVDKAQEGRPHEIDGKVVESKRLVPRTDIDKPESKITVKKLFVGGVRNEHDEGSLRRYFAKFGNIVNLNVAVDPKTGRRKGYAFVEYDDYDCVDKIVIQKLHFLKGVPLDVKKALTRQMAEKIARVNDNNIMNHPNISSNNVQSMMPHMNSMPPMNTMSPMNKMPPMNNTMHPQGNYSDNWTNHQQNHNWGNQSHWNQNTSSAQSSNNNNFIPQQQNRRNFQNNRMNPYQNKKTQNYNEEYNNPISEQEKGEHRTRRDN